ncbi:hypothetical protein FRC12_023837 [Ceratobasidium sp. 428]|nr:hypothetical protein FRC12_023837 [Ceratobasidium sp. 428]
MPRSQGFENQDAAGSSMRKARNMPYTIHPLPQANSPPEETTLVSQLDAITSGAPDTSRKQAHLKRVETRRRNIAVASEAARQVELEAQIQREAVSNQQAEASKTHRHAVLSQILSTLSAELEHCHCTFGELMVFAFDPTRSDVGRWRSNHFWSDPDIFTQLMGHWLSSRGTESGVKIVQEFTVANVLKRVKGEAQAITDKDCLKLSVEDMLTQSTEEFALNGLTSNLKEHCPTASRLFREFATSKSQEKSQAASGKRHKELGVLQVISVSMLSLLHEYNQLNNAFQIYSSAFLYAEGAGRQTISVVASYGNATSYSKLIAKPSSQHRQKTTDAGRVVGVRRRKPGIIYSLSGALRDLLREIAAQRPLGFIYDNIDIFFKVAEQSTGKIDTLESGTCATTFELFKADPKHMLVSDLMARFDKAPALGLKDILHSRDEAKLHRECMIFTILDIIVAKGGPEFAKYRALLDQIAPASSRKRELHHDRLHPLPTMHINESTIKGNIEICTTIFKEVGFDTSSLEFQRFVRLIAGDQLTVSRLRAIAKNRMGHESGYESFDWLVAITGLFHLKMAQAQGILETHLGDSNSSRNPVSLLYHQTLLFQKPLPSPAPFQTIRDLIRVSLHGRILDCLLLVSDTPELASLATKLSELDSLASPEQSLNRSFSRLRELAEAIYNKYANRKEVYKLREARKQAKDNEMAGDVVFEDSVLFICDALEFEEFIAAIKAGDSGRIITTLKLWTLSFQANGRSKYAKEMLHLIHNLTHVWSPGLSDIVLNNWVLNPTGKPNSHVELDLVQEHLNFWIKNAYRAHGSGASWEWLAIISPCVDFLRTLARQFHRSLGDDQGVRHAMANQARSIEMLMRSLSSSEVHTVKPGRKRAAGDGEPVVDVLSAGLQKLVHDSDNPLVDFNRNLQAMQQRRKLTPVTLNLGQIAPSIPSDTCLGEIKSAPGAGAVDASDKTEVSEQIREPGSQPKSKSECSSDLESEAESEKNSDAFSEAEGEEWDEEHEELDLEFELGNEIGVGFGVEDVWGDGMIGFDENEVYSDMDEDFD